MDEDMSPSSLIRAMHMAWVKSLGRRLGLSWMLRRGFIGAWMEDSFVEMDRYAIVSF